MIDAMQNETPQAHSERERAEDEQALHDHRAVVDRLLREYLDTAAREGADSFFTLTAEFLWHAEQKQFYALVNHFNYIHGYVPAFVAGDQGA